MKAIPTRVLVVDDERFFREAIRELLEGEGIELRLAASAAEALEAAEDPSIGVAVLDIQLPDQSGLTVLRILRERRPALRVVMLSAHTDQEYVLEALRLGACDYLAKPLHEEEVKLSVRRALEAYELASNWNTLRGRLGTLAGEIEALLGDGRSGRESLAVRAAEAVGRLLDAGKTSILLRDEPEGRLRVAAVTGRKLATAEFDGNDVGEGVAGRALARGEAIVVSDVDLDPRFEAAPGNRYDSNSFVVMPLGVGQGSFGALCATDRRGGSGFAEEDVALLRLLSLTLSPLLDPSQPLLDTDLALLEEVAELPAMEEVGSAGDESAARAGDSEIARLVCDAMTREVEPTRVLGSALRAVAESLGAAPVSVYLLEAESGLLRREAQWEADGASDRDVLLREAGLTGAAFESGQPIACADPAADPRFQPNADTPENGAVGAFLVLPIRFRGRTLGVCRVFSADPRAASPRTAEVLGAALSAAVRNVLLYRSLVESIEEVAKARKEATE